VAVQEQAKSVRKTIADARQALEKSQALIAWAEQLRDTLAETLDLCHRNHVAHEALRQDGSSLRQKAKNLTKKE